MVNIRNDTQELKPIVHRLPVLEPKYVLLKVVTRLR